MPTETQLLRLMTWLSPSFPVGAYSYSHGLEYAVDVGMVHDRDSLRERIAEILIFGSGRVDAELFRTAHEAVASRNEELIAWALERGDAMRATRELGEETENQGRAFLDAVTPPWPMDGIAWMRQQAEALQRAVVYPITVAAAAAAQEIPLKDALAAYLHAMAANLVSAGIRLIPLGQSDGQLALAELEAVILETSADAAGRDRGDIGSAAWMLDWASARHETQYTRLFRS